MSSYALLFKYIIIGDSGVGKSCLLIFKSQYDATIGVEFGSKIIKIDNQNIKLQIWDTAGQETFKSITRSYYRGSICALLVYDVTARDSFENIKVWLEETKVYSNQNLQIILVGNKIDQENERVISFEEGVNFAKDNGLIFFECSAKNGYNIELVKAFFYFNPLLVKIFTKSAKIISNLISNQEIDAKNESIGIKIGLQYNKKIDENEDGEKTISKCC